MLAFFIFSCVFFSSRVPGNHFFLVNCSLRLSRTYIIAYVNWTWTVSTGIVPFVALLLLNVAIFKGLRNVQRNLGRHKVGGAVHVILIVEAY